MRFAARILVVAALAASLPAQWAWAQGRVSDVRGTKHNLSAAADLSATPSGGTVPVRTVKASTETQVCVFCHTPHGATTNEGLTGTGAAVKTPLWNKRIPVGSTYTRYTSSSLDATALGGAGIGFSDQPGGSSKLCLSCHDGSLAVGTVNVLNGATSVTPTGTNVQMPIGSGTTTGFTRNLGTDLTNDHPISITFDDALSQRDGELRTLGASQNFDTVIGVRATGVKPVIPLEATGAKPSAPGQVQCATCHDPHIRGTNAALGNQKFLRMNRFQEAMPSSTFTQATDIICISCHDKNKNADGATGAWAFSAHAHEDVANETYKPAAAATREFPDNQPVWKASCLNCHDTHTVQGSRRLLREGTDSVSVPKAGGNPAIEQTCYQCHTTATNSVLNANTQVPNVFTDFTAVGNKRMPIANANEVHDVGGGVKDGADMIESQTLLGAGAGNLGNRHAECTDCHNPHRVVKAQNGLPGALTRGNTNDKAGTHRHEDASGYVHSNVISGVLRGAWGVEPTTYANNSFHTMPSAFAVKRGDPGDNTNTLAAASYVTREYQICLKCHSNYGYSDDNAYPNSSTRPQLGGTGLTAQNANGHTNFTSYTNQAKEFQAPAAHAVQIGSVNLGCDGGAGPATNCTTTTARNNNNHRSWHPVFAATGRTNRAAGGFLAPWNNTGAVGEQTMYCSDCHGSPTGTGTAMPSGNTNTNEDGAPWGPHGSSNNFLLKGDYSTSTGTGQESTGLCFKCHEYDRYAGRGGGTGFQTDKGDGHEVHFDRIDTVVRCNYCHVAVPHGWKNRGLLVNLNDVGPEAGLARNTSVSYTNNVGYTNGPYYRKAFLRVTSFPSGQWTESNCNGGRSGMQNNCQDPT